MKNSDILKREAVICVSPFDSLKEDLYPQYSETKLITSFFDKRDFKFFGKKVERIPHAGSEVYRIDPSGKVVKCIPHDNKWYYGSEVLVSGEAPMLEDAEASFRENLISLLQKMHDTVPNGKVGVSQNDRILLNIRSNIELTVPISIFGFGGSSRN